MNLFLFQLNAAACDDDNWFDKAVDVGSLWGEDSDRPSVGGQIFSKLDIVQSQGHPELAALSCTYLVQAIGTGGILYITSKYHDAPTPISR